MDIKDQAIEAVEHGWATETTAYDFVVGQHLGAADDARTRAKEEGYRNPLGADLFCTTCHTTENGHPSDRCSTGFIPGDPEEVRAANARRGFA